MYCFDGSSNALNGAFHAGADQARDAVQVAIVVTRVHKLALDASIYNPHDEMASRDGTAPTQDAMNVLAKL